MPEQTSHQVALTFEDGATRFITCRADQTVADASYRQRINIPLDCRDGACGTCKALCESGTYEHGTYIDDALTKEEASEGYCLPCQMRPTSDLVLQVQGTSQMAKSGASTWDSTVREVRRLSPSTVELVVEVDKRSELVFLPGQYVNITVPGTEEYRSYSFSSAPGDALCTFLVRVTPGGLMSDYLTDRAKPGDRLTFTGPHGSFFLRETNRPLLLVAGGTGLSPILSMLRQLASAGDERATHLLYGVRNEDDLVAVDQIERAGAQLRNFSWEFCLSQPHGTEVAGRPIRRGRVMSLLDASLLHGGDVAVYLCGKPAMVESVREHVAGLGVEPAGFYFEKFGLATSSAAGEEDVVQTGQGVGARGAEAPAPVRSRAELPTNPQARGIVGQAVTPALDGGEEFPVLMGEEAVGEGVQLTGARGIAGQEVFGSAVVEPLLARATAGGSGRPVALDGYQIGEEHPDVARSDAIFDAREALELGALELSIGRLTPSQVSGWRMLAEATVPHVEGDHFVDVAGFIETNGAFHDYLFGLTGNDHLLQAYQSLGVRGHMDEALATASWCDPLCTADHLGIVDAFERGDREEARELVIGHAGRSKATTRRAMAERQAGDWPKLITPGRFAGQVVVVTGAAQGIGAMVARRIAAEGGHVVCFDRSELVGDVVDQIRGRGFVASAVTGDLEHYEGAASLVREALAVHGRIDVLVNNVGGAINFKPFTEFTEREIGAEITRSLMTTLYACRAVLPAMVEAGGGVIVNVSSAATRGIHRVPYSAAKGGINAITASLALEYADRGIRVAGTAPGGTEAPPRKISRGTPEATNDVERAWFQAHIDQTLAHSLMHRYGTLEEQAAAICFLASPEASYVTGSVLPVAGGDQG